MASLPITFFILFGISSPETANPNPPISAITWVLFWCLLASSTLFVLYPVWFIGRRGQTLGMRRMKIRLFHVNLEGNLEAPTPQRAWGRAAMALACWLLFFVWILDYLWPLGDTRHQCLHDKVVRMVAVDVRGEPGVSDQDIRAPANDRLSR